jgi:toxin ParE1/3/4
MSYQLTVRRVAHDDIEDARRWYDSQRHGLGNQFAAAVRDKLNHLRHTPEMHEIVYKDIRRGLVGRFPYGVFYRVLQRRVVVIAVCHTKRDPKTWKTRA